MSGQPDFLLVPGLAFTGAGNRLGRGGGFYDRLLGNPGRRGAGVAVGIGFGFHLLPALPLEAHDAPLDEIVTDSEGGHAS